MVKGENEMNEIEKNGILEDFKKMITTESVVGEPIYIGDATVVPFVDISFGFGSGSAGSDGKTNGGAGGARVTPTAVLILKGERVELFSIRHAGPAGTADKLLNLIPEVISSIRKKKCRCHDEAPSSCSHGKPELPEEEPVQPK
jgi:uncharacterized spore protein YtfJ